MTPRFIILSTTVPDTPDPFCLCNFTFQSGMFVVAGASLHRNDAGTIRLVLPSRGSKRRIVMPNPVDRAELIETVQRELAELPSRRAPPAAVPPVAKASSRKEPSLEAS